MWLCKTILGNDSWMATKYVVKNYTISATVFINWRFVVQQKDLWLNGRIYIAKERNYKTPSVCSDSTEGGNPARVCIQCMSSWESSPYLFPLGSSWPNWITVGLRDSFPPPAYSKGLYLIINGGSCSMRSSGIIKCTPIWIWLIWHLRFAKTVLAFVAWMPLNLFHNNESEFWPTVVTMKDSPLKLPKVRMIHSIFS